MRIMVTKKEYEVVKALGFNMVKELSKAESITGMDEEDVNNYEKRFNNSFRSEKGKWGKMTVRKDESIGNNKIILDVNDDCIADIATELYNPIVMATIKCMVNIVKTFTSVFKKCEKTFDKIYGKWFEE